MAMTVIWTGMTALSLFCALALGNQGQLAAAALEGAGEAIQLGISMAGVLCLWMGVMEVMQRAGLAEKLARLLHPVLRRLFPDFARDRGTMDTIAANVSANLLGLGNAAPPGWRGTACACWWCATPPPSNSSPPRWRRCGWRRGARPPLTSCRRCG